MKTMLKWCTISGLKIDIMHNRMFSIDKKIIESIENLGFTVGLDMEGQLCVYASMEHVEECLNDMLAINE